MRNMRSVRRIALTAVAVSVVAGLAACSPGGSDDQSSGSSPGASQNADDGAGSGDDAGSAKAAGLDPSDLPDPVSSEKIPANVEGDPDATLTVRLLGLYRQGKTVTGQFSFTLNAKDGAETDDLYNYLGQQDWTPYFVDTTNLQKHAVLSDSTSDARTEIVGPDVSAGQTFYAYAVFAAPPEDVKKVDVAVVDGMSAVQGVTIQ
jgi:hypothetical protein